MTEKENLRLGFIGFGEAASRFAQDLHEAGLTEICAYSRSIANAAIGDVIHARAEAAGVELVSTPKALALQSNVIICLTPGAAAIEAARAIRRYLEPDHLYIDATTASVKEMEKLAALLEGRAKFVDAALMDPVPLMGIKVLTVASGPHAEEFRALFTPLGMNVSVIGDRPGMASAFKLIRSIVMKGLAALMLEALEAGQRYGITDALAADIARYFDERPFEQITKRLVCGTAIHAGRRVHEMNESIALLKSLGSSTRMTRATRDNLKEIVAMGLRERFDAREPESIAPVLDALIEARAALNPAARRADEAAIEARSSPAGRSPHTA